MPSGKERLPGEPAGPRYDERIPWSHLRLSLRSASGNPLALVPAVRQRLAQIDSDQPITEVQTLEPPRLESRTDLRTLPLLTIDPVDARDFDDAVWAEPDSDPANSGGWHLVVAIADVAWYVRPGSALDREAERRGNSVYFPDRVVPMLPEALSNELCSLKPGVDRACVAVHLWIDGAGRKRRHRFERGIMRSAARLTYEEVQAARNGSAGCAATPESIAACATAAETAEIRRGSNGTGTMYSGP